MRFDLYFVCADPIFPAPFGEETILPPGIDFISFVKKLVDYGLISGVSILSVVLNVCFCAGARLL